jgi:N-acetylglutamate synthase-like GNAT family acetyltransferase
VTLERVSAVDVDQLRRFLLEVDLTLAGLDDPTVHLWIERDQSGNVIGTTGFELSEDGKHALIRSVAVSPQQRIAGAGARLARYAMKRAASAGATRAWLFSRRSGPFWEKLGSTGADRDELAKLLPYAHQVRPSPRPGPIPCRSHVAHHEHRHEDVVRMRCV